MKKITVLSLVAATVLFTACGEKTKEAASSAASAVTEAVKADTTGTVDAAKKMAENAATAATAKAVEIAETAKVEAEKLAAKVTEAATETATETVTAGTSDNAVGKAAYAKCAGCHGADGKTKALGKSEVVAGQSVADLSTALKEYKAGTRNVSGMGMLMKGQVTSMDDATITAVSEYMSGL